MFTFKEVARDHFALLGAIGIARVNPIGVSAAANALLHMATEQPPRVEARFQTSGTPYSPDQARAIRAPRGEQQLARSGASRHRRRYANNALHS